MKNLVLFLLLFVTHFGMSQELDVDTKNASVSFIFKKDNTKGTISGISAKITLNHLDLAKSVIKGTADVNSLNTDNKGRDKHLKSSDFFDVEKYPTMKFTSSEITKDGDNYKVQGTLTIKNVKKDVTFTLVHNGNDLIFETTICSSDFGVSVKKGREKNKVDIKVVVPISK